MAYWVPSLHPPFLSRFQTTSNIGCGPIGIGAPTVVAGYPSPLTVALIGAPAHDLVFDNTGHERHQKLTAGRRTWRRTRSCRRS